MELLYFLIGLNVLIFAIPYIIPFAKTSEESHLEFMEKGWKSNDRILKHGEYYRLLTSTFLHSDIIHLLLNMFYLWQIGRYIIDLFGPFWFLVIYLTAGIGGSLASLKFNSHPSVGASGSLFGLIGALLLVAILGGQVEQIISIIITLAINIAYARMNPQIDNWAHTGGFIVGFLAALAPIFIQLGMILG